MITETINLGTNDGKKHVCPHCKAPIGELHYVASQPGVFKLVYVVSCPACDTIMNVTVKA